MKTGSFLTGISALFVFGLAAPAGAQGLQARFDSAQAAFEQKDWEAAAQGFGTLAADLPEDTRTSPVGAAILSRLGEAQYRVGAESEALATLEEADTLFTASGDRTREAYFTALLLANVLERRGFLASSGRSFERAYSLLDDRGPLAIAAIGAARTQLFSAPDRSRALLDAALAATADVADDNAEDARSRLLLLRGRWELNNGDPEAAEYYYGEALKIRGSRSRTVYLTDTRLRSEAGYAHFLQGEENRALERLKSAGANTQDASPAMPRAISFPDCGPTTGLERDDVVVLDLSLDDDWAVSSATPIYASRPGEIEEYFVQAARDMMWRPTKGGKEEARVFWRQSIHVEMRCEVPYDRISYARPVLQAFTEATGIGLTDQRGDRVARAREARSEARRLMRDQNAAAAEIIPFLVAMRASGTLDADERADVRELALKYAKQLGWALEHQATLWTYMSSPREIADHAERWIERLNANGSPHAQEVAAVIHANIGTYHEDDGSRGRAAKAFGAALSSAPSPTSLVAQFANLRLSALAAQRNDREGASRFLAASGLSPEQCSLLDSPPKLRSANVSAEDYPRELMQRGFKGTAHMNYDVSTDGEAVNRRVVFAFPPFIWTDHVEKLGGRLRYDRVYREGSDIGCGGVVQAFRFETY